MAFDTLVANAGRLRILAALAARRSAAGVDFTVLREATRLTDGNLTTHARRLSAGGMVRIEKSIRSGKPVTTFVLTPDGRAALEEHVRGLLAALGGAEPSPAEDREGAIEAEAEEPWID